MDQEKETEELAELVKIIFSTQTAPNSSTTTDGNYSTASAAVKLNAIIKRLRKHWNGVTPQQIFSRAVGMVNLEPNRNLVDKIMMSISSIGESDFYLSSTELDSHANMVVIGKQAFVYIHSVQYANVQAFEKEVKGLPKVPIVDAANRVCRP